MSHSTMSWDPLVTLVVSPAFKTQAKKRFGNLETQYFELHLKHKLHSSTRMLIQT